MKKYEFTGETMPYYGVTLRRIRALRDIPIAEGHVVKAGTLGGWIEKEENLSQDGNCWVFISTIHTVDDAIVFGEARISGDAKVFAGSIVRDAVEVTDHAEILGAFLMGRAKVRGLAHILPGAVMFANAEVYGPNMSRPSCFVYDGALLGRDVYVEASYVQKNVRLANGCVIIDNVEQ